MKRLAANVIAALTAGILVSYNGNVFLAIFTGVLAGVCADDVLRNIGKK